MAVGSLEIRHMEEIYTSVTGGSEMLPLLILKREVVSAEVETGIKHRFQLVSFYS